MQNELRSEYPDLPIQIVGVNEHGQESGNPLMTAGRTAPLLQDVDANNNGSSDVWYDLWGVTYRDVKILNKQNEVVGTVNLTRPAGYDLGEEINYDALKQIIADVAQERPFWQNPDDPNDVNNDQRITALDLLTCINELSFGTVSGSGAKLPLPMPPLMPTPYLDVNGDGLITAIDALRVINRLSEPSSTSEGESLVAPREPLSAEGESIPTPASLTGDSFDGQFATYAAQRLEPASAIAQPFTKVSDVRGESWHDDRRVDADAGPFELALESGSTRDGDSSTLSGEAVDSVFQCDDDLLAADSITCALIDRQPAT